MTSLLASMCETGHSWTLARPETSDYFSYDRGTVQSSGEGSVSRELPAGFPTTIKSPTAWVGSDFESASMQAQTTLLLNDAQIKEIENACRYFKALDLPFDDVSRKTFPLPSLGTALREITEELTLGTGFFIIKGLDPRRYSREDNIVIYLGISTYIGEQRGRQDELGNMILHLTDVGSKEALKGERQAPYSNVGQPFHTDGSDIIALYCLSEAECGGESQLASTATIYNELMQERRDMVELLASPSWIFDRFGQWPPYQIRPLLFPMPDEKILLSFSRRPLVGSDSSPRTPGIPNLSRAQVDAINLVEAIAERNCLSMKLSQGDMLFWNNLALLHSRTGFTDSSDQKRHLLRLWIKNDLSGQDWSVPDDLRSAWQNAFDHGARPQRWPLEPIRDRQYIINQQRSSGHS